VGSNSEYIARNQLTLFLRVRYGECDAQGVVFNARYADYADIAATEYLRALIGDYNELLKAGFENQVVSFHIDWQASAKFDDVLSLKVSTCHVGNTSFAFEVECCKRTNATWQAVANMKVTYVMVNASDFNKCPIPNMVLENFRKPFKRVVNQAG
jgi:acyl-CoA thioester hydrolase